VGYPARALAIVGLITLASGCAGAPPQGNASSTPTPLASASLGPPLTTSLPPTPATAPPVAGNALTKCENLAQQTYISETYRFSIDCPSNFSWQTYAGAPGRLFHARAVDDKYLNGYPAGEVEVSVAANAGNSLNDWVASHIGKPSTADDGHFWDSTSTPASTQISGRPAIGFDFVLVGPESPTNFHAAAFLLPEGSVFFIVWWAYSNDYAPVIAGVAQQMIASIQVFGA
jgi:hypothetical protein